MLWLTTLSKLTGMTSATSAHCGNMATIASACMRLSDAP